MKPSLRRFRGKCGERFSVLVDEEGIPLFYPTLFTTWILRANSLAANSITNALNALKALSAWEARLDIDLVSTFTQGVLLDHNQIRDLCDFLQRSLEDELTAKATSILKRPNVVGASVHYFRISTAAQYLHFLAHRVAPHVADSEINRMVEAIRAYETRGDSVDGKWGNRGQGKPSLCPAHGPTRRRKMISGGCLSRSAPTL